MKKPRRLKKHFEKLADALAMVRPDPCDWSAENERWNECVRVVADVCASENGRFDRERFVRACEERF